LVRAYGAFVSELIDVERVSLRSDLNGGGCGGLDVLTGNRTRYTIYLWHEHKFGSEFLNHAGTLSAVSGRHRCDQRMSNYVAHYSQA
jgi:hypothetical protein